MKKMIVTGNVGKEPEIKVDTTGNQFAIFTLGVSVGNKQEPKTDWLDVSCNGKLAEIARLYVKKGAKILIEGFPSVSAYINKDKQAIGILKVYASNLELLNSQVEEAHG